jgi:hypothetical protein
MLSWIIDTVAETVELPDHRTKRFSSLLNELLALRCISIKRWKKVLGELRSMVLAIPGGRCLFSTLYVALGDPSSDSRIKINRPIRDALLDLQSLAQDLSGRHTCIGELVDTLPVAYSTADACGTGMGCTWLSPDPNFTPLLWQAGSFTQVYPTLYPIVCTSRGKQPQCQPCSRIMCPGQVYQLFCCIYLTNMLYKRCHYP